MLKADWVNKKLFYQHTYLPLRVGDATGTIHVLLENHSDEPVRITYFESLPWIIKVYLHTLELVNGDIVETFYQTAQDSKRPAVLELVLVLPKRSKSHLKFDFERTFIKLANHHPDANHGFDLGYPLVIIVLVLPD